MICSAILFICIFFFYFLNSAGLLFIQNNNNFSFFGLSIIYWSAYHDAKLIKMANKMKFATEFHMRFGCLSMFVSLFTVMQALHVFAIIYCTRFYKGISKFTERKKK